MSTDTLWLFIMGTQMYLFIDILRIYLHNALFNSSRICFCKYYGKIGHLFLFAVIWTKLNFKLLLALGGDCLNLIEILFGDGFPFDDDWYGLFAVDMSFNWLNKIESIPISLDLIVILAIPWMKYPGQLCSLDLLRLSFLVPI